MRNSGNSCYTHSAKTGRFFIIGIKSGTVSSWNRVFAQVCTCVSVVAAHLKPRLFFFSQEVKGHIAPSGRHSLACVDGGGQV